MSIVVFVCLAFLVSVLVDSDDMEVLFASICRACLVCCCFTVVIVVITVSCYCHYSLFVTVVITVVIVGITVSRLAGPFLVSLQS